jgi:hypothetical protein
VTTYDEVKGNTAGVSVTNAGPAISVIMSINIPFTKVLDQMVDSVNKGQMALDMYYAMLDLFEHTIETYRNVRMK